MWSKVELARWRLPKLLCFALLIGPGFDKCGIELGQLATQTNRY